MSNLNHNANINDTRFSDLTKVVTRLGKDAAEGADALPKLAFAVVTAAYDGVIDTEKKHDSPADGAGMKVDDAAVIYATYMNAEGKKSYSDYKSTGIKANASKLRQLVGLGLNTKCEGPKVLARAAEIRDRMAKSNTKVLSAYPAFVNVARAQNDLDHEITDDEIMTAVAKPPAEDKGLVDYVTRAKKQIEKIITGENPDNVQSQDERLISAFEKLNEFLSMCERRAKLQAMIDQAAELGLNLTMEEVAPDVTAEGNSEADSEIAA